MEVTSIIEILNNQSYLIFFILSIIEGPIVTTLASFLASLGYFNIFLIYLIAVLGDITADLVLFLTGRFGKGIYLNKVNKKAHIGKKQFQKLKNNLETHPFKGMVFVKLVPPFALPGLIITGTTKISIWKFLSYSTIISATNKLIYVSIGFFSGITIFYLIRKIEYLELAIPLTTIIILAIVYGGYKLHKHIVSKLKNRY